MFHEGWQKTGKGCNVVNDTEIFLVLPEFVTGTGTFVFHVKAGFHIPVLNNQIDHVNKNAAWQNC